MKRAVGMILISILIVLLSGCSSASRCDFILYEADGYGHGKKLAEITQEQESKEYMIYYMLDKNEGEYRDTSGKKVKKMDKAPDYIIELKNVNETADSMDVYLWLIKEKVVFQYGKYPGDSSFNDEKIYVSAKKDYHNFMGLLAEVTGQFE